MSWKNFQKYASGYSVAWKKYEAACHEEINSTSLEDQSAALSTFTGMYGIARNMPRKRESGLRYKPVIELLGSMPELNEDADPSAVAAVTFDFARRLKDTYERLLLSAASKILWLKFRDPFVIYDSQARVALSMSNKMNLENFIYYHERWNLEFQIRKKKIETVCTKANVAHAKEQWFQRRAFDIYMWQTQKLPPLPRERR